jgi:hypothetical protein
VFQPFLFLLRRRPQQFVEVRGDWFGEGEEPDRGFVLLAALEVEPLEDLLGRLGRAEHLVEQREGRLRQGEHGQFRFGPEADSRLLQRRDRIHLRQRRERLVLLQIGEQSLGLFLQRAASASSP